MGNKTFHEYAENILKPYILSQHDPVQIVAVVWDRYITSSLKQALREARGKGPRTRIMPISPMPANWQKILSVDRKKTDLFLFLASI